MKKILIIEDEIAIIELLRARLEFLNFEVIVALNGEEGFLGFLNEQPDLIILDLMLPKISGYEVCRKIRREKHDNTPIIMLSAKGEDADRIVGRVKGADQYVTKPFKAEELLYKINLLLDD